MDVYQSIILTAVASTRQKLILPSGNISDTLGRGIYPLPVFTFLWCCDLPLAVLSLLEAFLGYLVTLGFPLQCNKTGAQKLTGVLLSMWWERVDLGFLCRMTWLSLGEILTSLWTCLVS